MSAPLLVIELVGLDENFLSITVYSVLNKCNCSQSLKDVVQDQDPCQNLSDPKHKLDTLQYYILPLKERLAYKGFSLATISIKERGDGKPRKTFQNQIQYFTAK